MFLDTVLPQKMCYFHSAVQLWLLLKLHKEKLKLPYGTQDCSWAVSSVIWTEALCNLTPINLFQLVWKQFCCIQNSNVGLWSVKDLAVMKRFHLDLVLWKSQIWVYYSIKPGITALWDVSAK